MVRQTKIRAEEKGTFVKKFSVHVELISLIRVGTSITVIKLKQDVTAVKAHRPICPIYLYRFILWFSISVVFLSLNPSGKIVRVLILLQELVQKSKKKA